MLVDFLLMVSCEEFGRFVSFFFSSRRRHTRCSRDWSSDVCSSDLEGRGERDLRPQPAGERRRRNRGGPGDRYEIYEHEPQRSGVRRDGIARPLVHRVEQDGDVLDRHEPERQAHQNDPDSIDDDGCGRERQGKRRKLGERWRVTHPKQRDRKSTRLNSSHGYISYAVFCLKKKKKTTTTEPKSTAIDIGSSLYDATSEPGYSS